MVQITARQLKIIMLSLGFALVFFVVYLLWGYQTISFPQDSASGVFVNGQFVAQNPSKLQLRPGSYTVRYTSASHADVVLHVHAVPFLRQTVQQGARGPSVDAAAKTASGAGTGGFAYNNRLFDTVWSAGIVKIPDSSQYLVMKYENGLWDTVYLGDGSDMDFKLVIPSDIQAYLLSLNDPTIGASNGN